MVTSMCVAAISSLQPLSSSSKWQNSIHYDIIHTALKQPVQPLTISPCMGDCCTQVCLYDLLFPIAELPLSNHIGVVVVKHILDFIDAFTVIVFSVEILLKWIDNFFTFWKDYWNVFDLIVTILVDLFDPSCTLIGPAGNCDRGGGGGEGDGDCPPP